MKKKPLEKEFYASVARWMRRHFLCFRIAINKGLRYGRIGVVGVRDVGGDFSGEIETIAVEVKRGATPFSNACGQTFGYRVYANRVYLADRREKPFNHDEIQIASCLGIGLIWMKGTKCKEVLSSPHYKPLDKLQLGLFAGMNLAMCFLCKSVFSAGEPDGTFLGRVSKDLKRAIKEEKGLILWNNELADRKAKLHIRGDPSVTWERRFICPDCVGSLLTKLANDE